MSWNRLAQRRRCLIVLLIAMLSGCQGIRPTSPSVVPAQDASTVTRAFAADLRGKVDFSGVRQTQSTPADVVGSATVSFIDLLTNATVATGKTDAAGAFSLSLAGYPPEVGRFYLLEAVKGLSNQAPGAAAARFRTILQWSGSAWLSCTNAEAGGPIVINALTTALALESALDALNVPASSTLGKIDATRNPAVLVPAPTYPGHPDSEIAQLATDLIAYLGAEADPVASVPSIRPAVASLTPGTGTPNALVRILGTGFSPAPSGNVVTFNGLGAQVLLATPTSLVVVVPSGATTGPVRVQTGRGSAVTAPFSVLPSFLETGSITIAGFSPTYGRADTVVTLTGEFGAGVATPSVTFAGSAGDRVPAPVLAWSPGSMTVTVPVGAAPGPITVRAGLATATSIASFDVWQGEISLMNTLTGTTPGLTNTYPVSIYGQSSATYGTPARYHYVIGGYASSLSQYDVRMYPVGADGTLGAVRWVGRLKVARYYASAVIVGDWLYVFGGTNNLGPGNYGGGVGSNLKSVERARINEDGTLGLFTLLGDVMNIPRQELRVIAKGNTLYLLGGYSSVAPAERKDYERFTVDPSTGVLTYLDTRSMIGPTGSFSNRSFGCQVVGDSIVMVGGYLDAAYSPKCMTLPILGDGTLATGSFGPDMTYGCYAPQSCVIDKELYVLGGYNGGYHTKVGHAPINTATGLITGPWVFNDSPDMGWNVSYTDYPLVVDKLIYTIGGYNAGAVIQSAEVMPDKSLSRWTQLGGTRENLYGYGAFMLGNRAWRIGGYSGLTSLALDTTEYYPIGEDGSWGAPRYGPTLKSLRYYPATVVSGDYLYVIGGSTTGSNNPVDTIDRAKIDRAAGEIKDFATLKVRLNQPRYFPASAVIGPYIYVFGGCNGSYLSSIERARINADGSLSPFELLPTTLTYTLGYSSAVVIGEYVYLVAGATPTDINYVQRARIAADGSIGAFTRTADMPYAVYGASTVRLGNYLWALGGHHAGNYATGQRAPVRPDGTLGLWETSRPGGRDILSAGASFFAAPPYVYKDWIFLASGYGNGVNVFQGTLR